MKIKKKDYEKALSNAYENGMRVALENPEAAKAYLSSETLRTALRRAGVTLKKAFENIGA